MLCKCGMVVGRTVVSVQAVRMLQIFKKIYTILLYSKSMAHCKNIFHVTICVA